MVLTCLVAVLGATKAVRAETNPPLSIVLQSTNDSAAPGETIVYRARIANKSSTTPTGAFKVTGDVPQHVLVTNVVDGGCGGGCRFGKTITWNVPSLAPGESRNLEYVAVVDNSAANPPPADGTKLVASITATLGGTSDTRSQTTIVAGKRAFDLAVVGTPNRVAPGKSATFTLSFGNRSNDKTPALLRMRLPTGTSFVSATADGALKSGAVLWDLGKVAPGVADRRQVVLKLDKQLAAGSLLAIEPEILAGKDKDSVVRAATTTLVAAQEPLSMAWRGPDPVLPGETAVFTLDLGNANASTPTGSFTVTANVPKHLLVIDVRGGGCGGGCRYGKKVTWNVPSLAPGANTALQIVATIDNSAAAPPPPNGATLVLDAFTPAFGGVGAARSISVGDGKAFDLGIGVEVNRVAPKGEVTYTIGFGNKANASAPVVLRVPVPAGTLPSSHRTTPSSCFPPSVADTKLVPAGFADRRRFTLEVGSKTQAGTLIVPEAELADAKSGQSLVRAATSSVVNAAQPFAVKYGSEPALLSPQATVVYKAELVNLSQTTPTAKLAVTGTVPRHMLVKSVAAGGCGGGCRYGKWITWNVPSLAAGGKTTLSFTSLVDNSAATPPPPNGSVLQSEIMLPGAGLTRTDLLQFVGTDKSIGRGGKDVGAPQAPAPVAAPKETKPKTEKPAAATVAAKPAPAAEPAPATKPAPEKPPATKTSNKLSINVSGSADIQVKTK